MSVPPERPGLSECVRLDRVMVRFGRHVVLCDATLSLVVGEYACVRGENGAGKTTLLRLVVGAIRPRRGTRWGPNACAYVPPALAPPAMTVAGWVHGVRRSRVDDPFAALAFLGFDGDVERSCRELSFGNLRKVLLADAFTSETSLIAVDEVHVGLDHRGRVGLERLVGAARERGATVVVTVQDDDAVDGIDRTLLVGDGRVSDAAGRRLDRVRHTLSGPRATEAEFLDAAQRLGFHLDPGDQG